MMRVLLADRQSNVRSALRLLLSEEPGVTVVGEASDMEQVLEAAAVERPDLVMFDWDLSDQGGRVVLVQLRSLLPQVVVIVLSMGPKVRKAAFAAGANAFVSKGSSPQQLLATLYQVSRQRP